MCLEREGEREGGKEGGREGGKEGGRGEGGKAGEGVTHTPTHAGPTPEERVELERKATEERVREILSLRNNVHDQNTIRS